MGLVDLAREFAGAVLVRAGTRLLRAREREEETAEDGIPILGVELSDRARRMVEEGRPSPIASTTEPEAPLAGSARARIAAAKLGDR